MISEADALDHILGATAPPSRPPESLPLLAARQRYAATTLTAPVPLPRFDQSAMDGYALRSADATTTTKFRVVGEQPAGPDRRLTISPGTAIRIFTGAPLPADADCVIRQEDVTRSGNEITLNEPPAPGEFIRRAGADLCRHQTILSPGEPITPTRIALFAALGISDVSVHSLPTIGLISTGDEIKSKIRNPKSEIQDGEILDSNTPLLVAVLAAAGFPVTTTTHADDTPTALAAALDSTVGCDAVILTGGVSVGEHDHVRATLRDRGTRTDLWRIAVKPGKPFLFARSPTTTYFGLPGNPVSTFVTALLFVLPGLRRLAGASPGHSRNLFTSLPTATEITNPGDRPHYLRGTIDVGNFHPAPLQESHALASLARSNALLRVAPSTTLPPGSHAPCIILPGF